MLASPLIFLLILGIILVFGLGVLIYYNGRRR